MALSRRGLAVWITTALVVVGVAVAVLFLGGQAGVGPLASGNEEPRGGGQPPPALCPLTGLQPKGSVPNRPALAVKVENLPSVRPQIGLSWADIVYEEPVEAGITRFIVVYQCQDAERIEPIRSARTSDPAILRQYGRPVFAYSGAVPQVVAAVKRAGLIDVSFGRHQNAYERDPARPAPHNLYSSTEALYEAADDPTGAPESVFTYSTSRPKGKKTGEVHLPFSSYSDVYWRWNNGKKAWLRWHADVPHTYSDGTQVRSKNVIVQVVKLRDTGITDVNGVASPEVVSVGGGVAYVFRNGRMIKGTWERHGLDDVTVFRDAQGNEISLAPGNTWVELLPDTISISTS
jgi:Protein of unknown function (DUF3048) N-terminal domain/Protein of unknown function (DUF3048) C-terminal domain